MAAGSAAALAGCRFGGQVPPATGPALPAREMGLPPIPPPRPGAPRVIRDLPAGAGSTIALTVDDGFDRETVRAYVRFAADSGVALMFNPNARYAEEWAPHARTLAPLIAAGQVQIGNHTFSHADLVRLHADGIRTEIERNEDWIQKTFGITSRPWLRPPYGHHNAEVDQVAADVGFTHVALWNASVGDSSPLSQQELLGRLREHVRPGALLLGHANYPAITHLYDQLVELIRERALTPQTLDEVFGTSRATG